jgi:serine/threonine-protein kinase
MREVVVTSAGGRPATDPPTPSGRPPTTPPTGIGSRPRAGSQPGAAREISPAERDRMARGSAGLEAESAGRLRCPSCNAAFRGNFSTCMRDGTALIRTTDDPLIGTTIADRYVIEELVGEGAMGLVYRAHHARLSRLFALKLMFGDVAADVSMRLRFAQEADAASRMSHPNVVAVLDFGKTDNGLLYLAMEYAEGETLAALLRREGWLPEDRVIRLAKQMARGLGHAHRAGLVHRDFKPANVATATGDDGQDVVRILDFGLAITGGDGHRIGRLTEHGLVVGTPIYISPEQARDQMVDHRADLFALGVVMYEMLAGKPPFEGTSQEIARANVTQTPPPIAHRNPQATVSPELEALVLKLMAKKPPDRYQSADEVIAALGAIARGTPPGGPRGGGGERTPSTVQRLFDRAVEKVVGPGRPVSPPGEAGDAAAAAAALHFEVAGGPIATSAATLLDATVLESGASSGEPGPAHAAADDASATPVGWARSRDRMATEGMTPAAIRRADGVARQIRRRGVVATAWFALATSGVVCTMMEGHRPASGQSGSQLAAPVGPAGTTAEPVTPTEVGAVDVGRSTSGDDVRVRSSGWWTHAVVDPVLCSAGGLDARLHQGGTAPGSFEGKMDPARARRCRTVQNAEPTGAERRWSSPARSAGTDRSGGSAPRSRASSPRRARQAAPRR